MTPTLSSASEASDSASPVSNTRLKCRNQAISQDLRLPFAFLLDDECYRDFVPTTNRVVLLLSTLTVPDQGLREVNKSQKGVTEMAAQPIPLSKLESMQNAFDVKEWAVRSMQRRGVDAVIWGMPLVSFDALRQAYFRDGKAK